jgi:hypothetical protein
MGAKRGCRQGRGAGAPGCGKRGQPGDSRPGGSAHDAGRRGQGSAAGGAARPAARLEARAHDVQHVVLLRDGVDEEVDQGHGRQQRVHAAEGEAQQDRDCVRGHLRAAGAAGFLHTCAVARPNAGDRRGARPGVGRGALLTQEGRRTGWGRTRREYRWQGCTGAAACTPPRPPARWQPGATCHRMAPARAPAPRPGRALLPYDMNWFCHRRALARSVAAKKPSTQKMTSDARFRNMMGVIASACARRRGRVRLRHVSKRPCMSARRGPAERALQPRTPRCT